VDGHLGVVVIRHVVVEHKQGPEVLQSKQLMVEEVVLH
jgi:hypothetical protein